MVTKKRGLHYERKSNWGIFYLATLLVFLNFWSSVTTIPLYVGFLGGRDFHAGIQGTLFFFGAVVFRFYLGPLSDRKGRKLILLVGAFAFATTPLLLLVFQTVNSVILLRLYQAVGLAAYFAAGPAFVGDAAPFQRLGTYMGIYRLIVAVGLLVGPALALEIIGRVGYDAWFWTSFVLGSLAFLLLLVIDSPEPGKVSDDNLIHSGKNILKDGDNREIYMAIALFSICSGIVFTFVPVFLESVVGMENPGIFFTVYSLAGIVASITVGALLDRLSPRRMMMTLGVGYGLGLVFIYPLSEFFPGILLAAVVMGAGFSGTMVGLTTSLIKRIEKERRGVAVSLQENTIDVFMAAGSFVFPAMISLMGYGVSFSAIGIFLMGMMGLSVLQRRKKQKFNHQTEDL